MINLYQTINRKEQFMPRKARLQSEIQIYHVMLRGNNKQRIFYDEIDNLQFIKVLNQTKETCNFSLYAYCLMPNHIHLLIKTSEVPLAQVMKKIEVKYVKWYNAKYERCGHLFQDRFKSEIVGDYCYFVTVLRYILQNPVKAELCKTITNYRYSSASEYFGEAGITDTAFAFEIYQGPDLKRFLLETNTDRCMEPGEVLYDSEAASLVCNVFGCELPFNPSNYNSKELAKAVIELLQAGLTQRQLSRLTGIPVHVIRYIVVKSKAAS